MLSVLHKFIVSLSKGKTSYYVTSSGLHSLIKTLHRCSIVQSCSTLLRPHDGSTPCIPVHYHLLMVSLLKVMSVDLVMPSQIPSSVIPFSSCLQSFPASGSFPMSQFFSSGVQSIGVSPSTIVLIMNIQD